MPEWVASRRGSFLNHDIKLSNFNLTIHRIVHLPGWYMSCYKLDIDGQRLDSEDIEIAKTEALKKLRGIADKKREELRLLQNTIKEMR